MTKFRLAAAAVTVSCALMLAGGAGTAAAQDSTMAFGKKVPITGEAKNGKRFTGTYIRSTGSSSATARRMRSARSRAR